MRSDKHSRNFIVLMAIMTVLSVIIALTSSDEVDTVPRMVLVEEEESEPAYMADVKGGIHVPTGLAVDTHLDLVLGNCIACHSADVIRNTRLSEEGWSAIITWMQEKQNLWDLGQNKKKIVAYLAKNYAPEDHGRRKNLALQPDDWYVLED